MHAGAEQSAAVDVAVQNAVKPLEEKLANRRTRKLGIVMTVVGLAVAGGGLAWYFLDDSSKMGLATATGGGGLAAGGIGVLVF